MNCHAYLLFLKTWDACLAMQNSHTDVNWHLGNTWLLWFFLSKLDNWTSYANTPPISSLAQSLLWSISAWFWCLAVLMLLSPAYLQWVGLYPIIWLEIGFFFTEFNNVVVLTCLVNRSFFQFEVHVIRNNSARYTAEIMGECQYSQHLYFMRKCLIGWLI